MVTDPEIKRPALQRPSRLLSGVSAITVLVPLTACAVTVPSSDTDPRVPPFEGGVQGDFGSTLVEYLVLCRGCSVEYTSPRGREVLDDTNGFQRRIQFRDAAAERPHVVTLRVKPAPGSYVTRASITIDGREAASKNRASGLQTDENVVLTAPLPRGDSR